MRFASCNLRSSASSSFETIAAYDKTVLGSVGSSSADFEAAIRLLPELDLNQHLKHRLPLTAFDEAWQKARNGDELKIILSPSDDTLPSTTVEKF